MPQHGEGIRQLNLKFPSGSGAGQEPLPQNVHERQFRHWRGVRRIDKREKEETLRICYSFDI